jgi:hypothetical protein
MPPVVGSAPVLMPPVLPAPVLPAPVLPAPVPPGAEVADGEADAGAELLTGGGDLVAFAFAFDVVELLADGHGRADVAAADLARADTLAGAPLALIPGRGGLVPTTGGGDVIGVGGVVSGGGVVAGGGVVGLALAEPVARAGGLDLRAGGGVVHPGPGPGAAARPLVEGPAVVPNGVPPPVPPPPPLPPGWAGPLFETPSAEGLELVETTCGSSATAKPPAATTKTAMLMPATGRSQPYRGRAWPGRGVAGRKRSMTARQAAMTGSIQRRSQAAVLADQASADSRDSIGRLSRSLIRSSPSADGSIESAAACSARRRTSS